MHAHAKGSAVLGGIGCSFLLWLIAVLASGEICFIDTMTIRDGRNAPVLCAVFPLLAVPVTLLFGKISLQKNLPGFYAAFAVCFALPALAAPCTLFLENNIDFLAGIPAILCMVLSVPFYSLFSGVSEIISWDASAYLVIPVFTLYVLLPSLVGFVYFFPRWKRKRQICQHYNGAIPYQPR